MIAVHCHFHSFKTKVIFNVVIIILIVSLPTSKAYSGEIDSLRIALETEEKLSNRSIILKELVRKYYASNKDSAQYFAWKVVKLEAKGQSDFEATMKTYLNLAKIKRFKQQYDSALYYGELAFAKLKFKNDLHLLSETYESVGRSYLGLLKHEQAVENFMKGFELAEQLENWNLMANIAGNCSKSLDALERPEEALALCLKVLNYDKDDEISKEYNAVLHSWLGVIYIQFESHEKAREHFKKSVELLENENQPGQLVVALIQLARLHRFFKDYEKAGKTLIKAQELAEEYQLNQYARYISAMQARISSDQGYFEVSERYYLQTIDLITSRESKNIIALADYQSDIGVMYFQWRKFDQAREYLQRAEILYASNLKKLHDRARELELIYSYLYRVDSASNKFISSLEYHKLYRAYKDSLITYEQQEAFDKLNLAHESKQKDKEIVLLTAQAELQALQAEQRSLWLYIFIGGTVLMFVLLIIIYNRYKLKQKSVKIISNQKEDIERKNAENVTLIREIHHRVKNNLQIMYSLLNSQSNILKDDNAKIIIKESKDRIKSMALIHDHLYQSGSFVKVNAREYFQNLTDNIKTSFNSVDKKVHLNLDIPDTDIRLDMAVPLGLIVNELITNSYKYAFQNVSRGELQLHFERIEGTDSYQLEIADNGCGLPENFEIEKTESFGLQLVKGLTEQLGGTLKIINGVGTTFNIAVKNFEHV